MSLAVSQEEPKDEAIHQRLQFQLPLKNGEASQQFLDLWYQGDNQFVIVWKILQTNHQNIATNFEIYIVGYNTDTKSSACHQSNLV